MYILMYTYTIHILYIHIHILMYMYVYVYIHIQSLQLLIDNKQKLACLCNVYISNTFGLPLGCREEDEREAGRGRTKET